MPRASFQLPLDQLSIGIRGEVILSSVSALIAQLTSGRDIPTMIFTAILLSQQVLCRAFHVLSLCDRAPIKLGVPQCGIDPHRIVAIETTAFLPVISIRARFSEKDGHRQLPDCQTNFSLQTSRQRRAKKSATYNLVLACILEAIWGPGAGIRERRNEPSKSLAGHLDG